jgi:hypothetical protein
MGEMNIFFTDTMSSAKTGKSAPSFGGFPPHIVFKWERAGIQRHRDLKLISASHHIALN